MRIDQPGRQRAAPSPPEPGRGGGAGGGVVAEAWPPLPACCLSSGVDGAICLKGGGGLQKAGRPRVTCPVIGSPERVERRQLGAGERGAGFALSGCRGSRHFVLACVSGRGETGRGHDTGRMRDIGLSLSQLLKAHSGGGGTGEALRREEGLFRERPRAFNHGRPEAC